MVSQSYKINLVSKVNPTVFKLINKDVFGNLEQRLGSVQGAVNKILIEHEQMLKVLMPTIVNTSPDDQTWYKKVSTYWHSFSLNVPVGGKELERGFNFSLTDASRRTAIQDLIKIAKEKKIEVKTDEDLRDYVLKEIPEFEKYKYASPINTNDYLTWVFCLGNRKVANKSEFIEKSTNIEFVLIDPKDIENTRRTQHILSIEATKKYLEVLTDRTKVKDILYIKGENASIIDDLDIDAKLKMFADNSPKQFLTIVNDPTMTTRAKIERYCIVGILKRLSNSSIIVDGLDNGIVIGNTVEEAVAYFNSESADRLAKVSEFKTRYAQLKKV